MTGIDVFVHSDTEYCHLLTTYIHMSRSNVKHPFVSRSARLSPRFIRVNSELPSISNDIQNRTNRRFECIRVYARKFGEFAPTDVERYFHCYRYSDIHYRIYGMRRCTQGKYVPPRCSKYKRLADVNRPIVTFSHDLV